MASPHKRGHILPTIKSPYPFRVRISSSWLCWTYTDTSWNRSMPGSNWRFLDEWKCCPDLAMFRRKQQPSLDDILNACRCSLRLFGLVPFPSVSPLPRTTLLLFIMPLKDIYSRPHWQLTFNQSDVVLFACRLSSFNNILYRYLAWIIISYAKTFLPWGFPCSNSPSVSKEGAGLRPRIPQVYSVKEGFPGCDVTVV